MTFDSISQVLRKGVIMDLCFTVKPPSEHLVTVKQGQEVYQSFYDTILTARAVA